MDKKLKNAQAEKIRRRLTKDLKSHGFERTKPSFWTRQADTFIQFIHLHLFRSQSSFRVHLGIRVLNDSFEAPALNGPNSDEFRTFNLRFHNTEDSIVRCVNELLRYCVELGIPWFNKWNSSEILLSYPDSPIQNDARTALQAAVNGKSIVVNENQSRTLLGIG